MDIMVDNPVRAFRGNEIGAEMFTDIPGFVESRWTGKRLRVRFDRDVTADERNKVLDRVQSATVTEEQMRTGLRAYLAIKNPNTQQDRDAIRQLIMLALDDATAQAAPTTTPQAVK